MSKTKRPASPSERTRVKRYHWLADYDRKTLEEILDAVPLCHVGYAVDSDPYVTPTLQWRIGNRIYWHGSSASRMLKQAAGADVCLAVTALDGLVLARSAYNFNVNFRSAMIFGKAQIVADKDEKLMLLRSLVDRFVPDHWDKLRPVTEQELKATTILGMDLNEASCKVRVGPPQDEDDDYDFPVWAGVLPIAYAVGSPEPDPRNLPGMTMPARLTEFRIG